jgi:Fe-Mn family superoxide dismutase
MRTLPKIFFYMAAFAFLMFPAIVKAEVFSVPALNYEFDALEPVIDSKTMETHVTKHHQGYVNNLNKEIENTSALQEQTLEDILAGISAYGPAIRNNAGGHWNHKFFWNIMAPENATGQISPALNEAIIQKFGSLDAMKEAFVKAGTSQFGSGWVWLIVKEDKTLDIVATPNQDNPLMDDAPVKGRPVLGNDVWEHAYYLNYQNRRSDYLDNWWRIVNWDQASKNYAAARVQ